MGKASRRKGANYERELALLFQKYGWDDAKRHLEYQSDEAEMGRDLDGTEPFAVQAKCWKSTPSIAALDQIQVDDEYPIRVAILKRTQSAGTHGLEVAALDLDVFMRMLESIERLANLAYEGLTSHHDKETGQFALDPWEYIAHGKETDCES